VVDVRVVEELSEEQVDQLADLLIAVIEQGASVGYLPPVDRRELRTYWKEVIQPGNLLLVTEREGRIVGTVQLELAKRANGRHRAEVNKLLVDPAMQRRGIGRALMAAAEARAREQGRTLLHLDTREGDVANQVYQALGWTMAGTVPNWARSSDGTLAGTVFYYKELER
jgi:GNAT superfamily N-acetyltransferase